MREKIIRLMHRIGLIRTDLIIRRAAEFPRELIDPEGVVVLVEDKAIRKWTCLRCPGGCGARIDLTHNPIVRPRWTIFEDFWLRPTIHPSVHQKNECGCHFWIRKGKIEWCKDGHPSERLIVSAPVKRVSAPLP